MERVIQLASSLPDNSPTQVKLTGTLIKGLWDSLQHPPMSYMGDEHEYRTPDGSNNVRSPQMSITSGALTNKILPLELLPPQAWNGWDAVCEKRSSFDYWEAISGSGRGVR